MAFSSLCVTRPPLVACCQHASIHTDASPWCGMAFSSLCVTRPPLVACCQHASIHTGASPWCGVAFSSLCVTRPPLVACCQHASIHTDASPWCGVAFSSLCVTRPPLVACCQHASIHTGASQGEGTGLAQGYHVAVEAANYCFFQGSVIFLSQPLTSTSGAPSGWQEGHTLRSSRSPGPREGGVRGSEVHSLHSAPEHDAVHTSECTILWHRPHTYYYMAFKSKLF